MAMEPLQYFNRYSGRIETEQVYGEKFLRFTYGNPLGKLSLHGLVKRALFSRWYGQRMDHPASARKVQPFLDAYKIDQTEFADAPESFRTFNEFFYRRLKPEARPIHPEPSMAVFPADGRHLGFQNALRMEGIFVKGQVFDLRKLLKNSELAAQFREGVMVLSRLCPLDYHRFHFPVGGIPERPVLIEGPLYSVNPLALKQNIHILAENRRSRCLIRSDLFGLVVMLEIGATCVGSFNYTFQPGLPVAKGAEKGYFKFGGSSMITLFEPGRVQLADDLIANSKVGRELYARVGDAMGRLV